MITVNLYYRGTNGVTGAFKEEMEASGIAENIPDHTAPFVRG